jgi:hypothetical protein
MLELFRQCDIYFFHFIVGYAKKKPDELQLFKKNMVVIVFRNYNRQNEIKPNELISNGDLFQRHLKYTLKEFYITFTICY